MKNRALLNAFIAHRRAEQAAMKKLNAAILRAHPVGKPVAWMKGRGGSKTGVVLEVFADRLRVRSDISGKEYGISVYDVLCNDFSTDEMFPRSEDK